MDRVTQTPPSNDKTLGHLDLTLQEPTSLQKAGPSLVVGRFALTASKVNIFSKTQKIWSVKAIRNVGIHQTSIVFGSGMGSKRDTV